MSCPEGASSIRLFGGSRIRRTSDLLLPAPRSAGESPPNNYYTVFYNLKKSYPFRCFLSIRIQASHELPAWQLSIEIV